MAETRYRIVSPEASAALPALVKLFTNSLAVVTDRAVCRGPALEDVIAIARTIHVLLGHSDWRTLAFLHAARAYEREASSGGWSDEDDEDWPNMEARRVQAHLAMLAAAREVQKVLE